MYVNKSVLRFTCWYLYALYGTHNLLKYHFYAKANYNIYIISWIMYVHIDNTAG